jgi:hypothetical protein
VSRSDGITRPHACPHCICLYEDYDGMGMVNKDAPFYPLITLILEHERAA